MRPASTGTRRHLPAICAALVALALGLPACGSDEGEDSTAALDAGSAQVLAPVGQAEVRAAAACRAELGDFLGAMDRLRGRLAAGISYDQYAGAVRRVQATYEGIDVLGLPAACLVAAGTPGERAFNGYLEAANAWGACLADAGCDSVVVEPRLQREWRVASHFLSEALAGAKG